MHGPNVNVYQEIKSFLKQPDSEMKIVFLFGTFCQVCCLFLLFPTNFNSITTFTFNNCISRFQGSSTDRL